MLHAFERFITDEGIENLKKYKYVPGVYSYLDNLLNPVWIAVTERLPRNLAPNAITLTGLLLLLSSTIFYFFFDRDMSTETPWYTYMYSSIAVFLYCHLDAIDGKQARRLGKGSPLGQLFDHGCDCIAIGLLIHNVIMIWELGADIFYCFLITFVPMFMYYSSNWAEYFTRVLVTSNGVAGVTELELIVSAVNFATAIWGPGIWQYKLLFGLLIRIQNIPNSASFTLSVNHLLNF